MKLIFCPKCSDVVKLWKRKRFRRCTCRKSYGRYIDDIKAEIGGEAIPLVIDNRILYESLIEGRSVLLAYLTWPPQNNLSRINRSNKLIKAMPHRL